MAVWVDVGAVDDIPCGGFKVVDVDDAAVAVFNVDGELYAIEDVCTHDGGTLSGGEVHGDEVECPRHGARFSIRTGEVTAPPAYEPVRAFSVRVQQGRVQVLNEPEA